jgi:hypothetical protein
MFHPGMPEPWAWGVLAAMLLLIGWALARSTTGAATEPASRPIRAHSLSLSRLPLIGSALRTLTLNPWPLLFLKLVTVTLFLLVIAAGLFGTPIPERSLATVLTWNIWWAGLIVSVFFLGSAWCAICPWDALATWLVRMRLIRRADQDPGLGLRPPPWLRSVWPALIMFSGLTWLELGWGVTTSPYATALLSLLMVVLATVFIALYERRAFCRYVCPVGRTIGFYSQLAPVELRPLNTDICASCTTLECYHGNEQVEPCPTSLVMGRLQQNSYCLSCGNCTRSCPDQNVGWRLRAPSVEAIQDARPHNDEAWFMLGLLALTLFHGVTMMSFWEGWLSDFARLVGDSGRLLLSFSVGMLLSMTAPLAGYALLVELTRRLVNSAGRVRYGRLFSGLAFVALPLAFAYHLAHNLNHLVREHGDLTAMLANPLGRGLQPMSMAELHARSLNMAISEDSLFAIQAGLILFGFWIAVQVLRHRLPKLLPAGEFRAWQLVPLLLFSLAISGFGLWLLTQPMVMRL